MTPTHPATGRPLLDQSEAEQALRVLAGVEPRPTCGTCKWADFTRARLVGGTIWSKGRCRRARADHRIGGVYPACDLWEPRR